MNFGISTACFYPMLTEQALLEISKRNVPYAEVFVDTFSEVKKEFVTELRKTADFYGTKISSLHPFTSAFEPFMLFTNYERRFNDALELHRHYFEAMNILGAKIFVFHGDRAAGKNDNETYFERFARLRDIGKEHGVIVAQENVERCKSRSKDFLCDMVKYLDNDVAIVFDNKQAFRSGEDWGEFIDCLNENIVHVHISDNGKKGDCLALGKGELDINSFLNRLASYSYKGAIIVELYNELLENGDDVFDSFRLLRLTKS